ncbi:nuclear transport factor 2 family protein [Bacteroidota bacterium]
MVEHDNIKLIKEHFAAFARGDIRGALGIVDSDVDWQSPVTRTKSEELTWATPRHSREEVLEFFLELADNVQPEKFEIIGFIAQGDKVVVEGCNRGLIKSTGKIYEHDWVMVFTLRDGKIVSHRHYYDTADVALACR